MTSPSRTKTFAITVAPNSSTETESRRKSAHALASRLALSPDEAAATLGVSRTYLDEHIAHELRWVRRGRRKFVSVRELERWLDESAERTLGGAA